MCVCVCVWVQSELLRTGWNERVGKEEASGDCFTHGSREQMLGRKNNAGGKKGKTSWDLDLGDPSMSLSKNRSLSKPYHLFCFFARCSEDSKGEVPATLVA